MADIRVDFRGLYSDTARVSGLSVPGKSLIRSNTTPPAEAIEWPRERAADFAVFAERRGLKVERIDEHVDRLYREI